MAESPGALAAEHPQAEKNLVDNKSAVQEEAARITDQEKKELGPKLDRLKVEDNIPAGGVVLDVGCGNGAVGVLAASERSASLIQADFFDQRNHKVGELKTFPRSEPGAEAPNFTGVDADAILLVDVIHHVGYGNGWNHQTNTPDPAGRVEDCLKFVTGVATGLNETGKILLLNTRAEGKEIVGLLERKVDEDLQLKGRVKFL